MSSSARAALTNTPQRTISLDLIDSEQMIPHLTGMTLTQEMSNLLVSRKSIPKWMPNYTEQGDSDGTARRTHGKNNLLGTDPIGGGVLCAIFPGRIGVWLLDCA